MNIRNSKSLSLRWFFFAAALVALTSSWADKIHLLNGDVISGTIKEETADTVKIEVRTGTIKDTKVINRVSIGRIEKTTPEDSSFEVIEKLLPTPDGVSPVGYQKLLSEPKAFLTKYPSSKYAEQVKGIISTLESELARVEGGSLKFRGNWLTAIQQRVHEENIHAQKAKVNMARNAREKNTYIVAMRIFADMEKKYAGSLAFPEAVEIARATLPKYAKHLSDEIVYAKHLAAQQAKGRESLAEHLRIAYDKDVARLKANFQKKVQGEIEKGWIWLTVDMESEASLNEGIARIKKEAARLSKFDVAALKEQADLVYEAEELLAEEKLDQADTKFAAALKVKNGAKAPKSTKTTEAKSVFSEFQAALEVARFRAERATERAAQRNAAAIVDIREGGPESNDSGPTSEEDKAAQERARQALIGMTTQTRKVPTAPAAAPKKTAPTRTTAPKRREPPVRKPSGGFSFKFLLYLLPVGLIGFTAYLFIKQRGEGEAEE